MTPPRDGDRTVDDRAGRARHPPAPPRHQRRRARRRAGRRHPSTPSSTSRGSPPPCSSSHDMWDEPANQLCTPAPAGAADAARRPDAAAAAAAARSAAGAGGRVRPRGARGRRGDNRLARGAPRPPARRSRARPANQHHGGARTSREPCCLTAALIADYLARRRSRAAGSRARRPPRACAGAAGAPRLVAPRERGADHAGQRGQRRARTLRRRRRTRRARAARAMRAARVPFRARRRLPIRTGACRATSRAELPTKEMTSRWADSRGSQPRCRAGVLAARRRRARTEPRVRRHMGATSHAPSPTASPPPPATGPPAPPGASPSTAATPTPAA